MARTSRYASTTHRVSLLWSQTISTGLLANDIASSLALSPDGAQVAVTGSISGGARWITTLYDTSTGTRKWLVANTPKALLPGTW